MMETMAPQCAYDCMRQRLTRENTASPGGRQLQAGRPNAPQPWGSGQPPGARWQQPSSVSSQQHKVRGVKEQLTVVSPFLSEKAFPGGRPSSQSSGVSLVRGVCHTVTGQQDRVAARKLRLITLAPLQRGSWRPEQPGQGQAGAVASEGGGARGTGGCRVCWVTCEADGEGCSVHREAGQESEMGQRHGGLTVAGSSWR